MKQFVLALEQIKISKYLLKWVLLVLPVALFVGSTVALFLYLLDKATVFRWHNSWLLYLLPIAGVAIVSLYRFKGKNTEAGNNLVMDEIHKPGGGIPFRMAPFILISTVITHLFGGSAGREGTAVQIGGSLASFVAKTFKLSSNDTRILLMTGVAAGFGAVFGTPIAGAIFALEVLAIGRIKYDALLPCLLAAIMAHITCMAYGITHTSYSIEPQVQINHSVFNYHFDALLILKVIASAVVFGLISHLFSSTTRSIKKLSHQYIKHKYLIPFVGGTVIIALTLIIGSTDYLGLGVSTSDQAGTTILNSFKMGEIDSFGWFWKLIFTAITLGMGFKGGEVTPLFFIGATLGNTLALTMNAPVDLMAALGFIAVFAGATNTPIASTLLGVELFGGASIIYYATACFTAYYFSGHGGIYTSQKISVYKFDDDSRTDKEVV